jgi:hypothetical protein
MEETDEENNQQVHDYRKERTETITTEEQEPNFSLVTTRSMVAQLKEVMNDPLEEAYDLKRKIFQHKENVFDFFGKKKNFSHFQTLQIWSKK